MGQVTGSFRQLHKPITVGHQQTIDQVAIKVGCKVNLFDLNINKYCITDRGSQPDLDLRIAACVAETLLNLNIQLVF